MHGALKMKIKKKWKNEKIKYNNIMQKYKNDQLV